MSNHREIFASHTESKDTMRPLIIVTSVLLAGCATDPRDFNRDPHMTAVGSGLSYARDESILPTTSIAPPARGIAISDNYGNLFRDVRAKNVGDIVTITITMDDRAKFGNSTDRSRDSKVKSTWAFLFNFIPFLGAPPTSASANASNEITGSTSSQGQGSINRSEQIRFSIATVVTDVLPNGNLVVQGSQEFRVNQELRVVTVAGIVRPLDLTKDNTISYDKIAEARVSYGGRGRLMEVQQPAWGHQAYNVLWPF